jgi:Family of unknown function (DUF5995)
MPGGREASGSSAVARVVATHPGADPTPESGASYTRTMGEAVCSPEPVASIEQAVDRMHQIAAALPSDDGVACFNRMYLGVTQEVGSRISVGFFEEPAFMETVDVQFANLYFEAVSAPPGATPLAWRPLFDARSDPTIHPMQFALAGMDAHINHDLPIAVVRACAQLELSPTNGPLHSDYQKIDVILDEAEQSVRQSFETRSAEEMDAKVEGVLDALGNWSIAVARDMAWGSALVLWKCRNRARAEAEVVEGLGKAVARTSRLLLE